MARNGGVAVDPGVIRRVVDGVRWAVSGKAPDAWFGPLQAMPPQAPADVAGRRFDYPFGFNQTVTPLAEGGITFDQLRRLSDAYDLLRLVIETRKDQIARLDWCIKPRDGGAPDGRIQAAAAFFQRPDREHDWAGWLRMLVEDMLVIDAACLYVRRDRAGRLFALEPVDGATIKRLLDDRGRTPQPPAPAFQQVLKGLPAVNYRVDELYYLARNARSHRVYGQSPVEQVAMTVNIALRRQLHLLQYYTEGSVPDALIGVPESWTPEQIADFQTYWDALLEGDSAARRHARFVPATISKSYVATKEAALTGQTDEWLARLVCFAFSVSPSSLTQPMNRASAEAASDQADAEGLAPLKAWVKGVADRALADGFGWPDLEFAWAGEAHRDPLAEAQVAQIYLASGVLTAAEVRASLGLAPLPKAAGEADAGNDAAKLAKYNPHRRPPGSADGGRFCAADEAGGGNTVTPDTLPSPDPAGATAGAEVIRPFQVAANDTGTATDAVVGDPVGQQVAAGIENEEVGRRGVPESPAEELRSELYETYRSGLARIDPDNRNIASISRRDWVPSEDDVQAMREDYDRKVDEIANRIASGHAYEKHGAELACFDPVQLEAKINSVIRAPDESRALKNGRSFYYRRNGNILVIVDPDDSDGGTVFRPSDGTKILNKLR